MSSIALHHARIFIILVRRDLYILTAKLRGLFIDSSIPLITQVLTYGYLFPLLGLPSSSIIPVYLGSMLGLFMHLGFAYLMRVGSDLTGNRFIQYQSTLPLSKFWLFAAYIVSNIIETMILTVPLVSIGLWILRAHLDLSQLSVAALLAVIVTNQLFMTTFYLACAMYYDFYWLIDNFWPRRLVPLFCFSAALVPWKQVYAWWPLMGNIMLLSPLTHIAEGMRSAILGNQFYLHPLICISALLIWTGICVGFLVRGISKKLDPV